MWLYGGISGNWRYGLNWATPRAVGAYLLVPPLAAAMFFLWCVRGAAVLCLLCLCCVVLRYR
jgi:hypothetical protein